MGSTGYIPIAGAPNSEKLAEVERLRVDRVSSSRPPVRDDTASPTYGPNLYGLGQARAVTAVSGGPRDQDSQGDANAEKRRESAAERAKYRGYAPESQPGRTVFGRRLPLSEEAAHVLEWTSARVEQLARMVAAFTGEAAPAARERLVRDYQRKFVSSRVALDAAEEAGEEVARLHESGDDIEPTGIDLLGLASVQKYKHATQWWTRLYAPDLPAPAV